MALGRAAAAAIAQGVAAASAGTAKTVLNLISASSKAFKVTEIGVAFIGGSGSAKPVLVELCASTQGGAGSGSSSVTPKVTDSGNSTTVDTTAAKGYTSEPTTLTVIRSWRVYPQVGLVWQVPVGREPAANNGNALAIRVTFESGETTTNIDAYAEFEE